MTRGELVAELAAMLGARHEARFVVDEVTGTTGGGDRSAIGAGAVEEARAMAARRSAGEPLQYILGHWAFRTLDLIVDPRVLIPRPETEQVVEVAVGELAALGASAPVMVDLGTGSGAIALSLATEVAAVGGGGCVWAVDASADALDVAAANLERVAKDWRGPTPMLPVSFVQGQWCEPLPDALRGSVDLVVSNPPYVDASEWAWLPCDVRHEPRPALVSAPGSDGSPGLHDVETVLAQAVRWLGCPGSAVVELAPHQSEAAIRMALRLGYSEARIEPDLAGVPRALVARRR